MVAALKENIIWTTGTSTDVYQKEVFGKNKKMPFTIHDFSHVIGAGLTHPDRVMDIEAARKWIPKNRFSGNKSEPIERIYRSFLEDYPIDRKGKKFDLTFSDPDTTINQIINHCIEADYKGIVDDYHRISLDIKPDSSASKTHNNARKKIAEEYMKHGIDSIVHPSNREMMWHWGKAKELCETFKEKTGFFPSEIIVALRKEDGLQKLYDENNINIPRILEGVESFEDLPLSLFEVDNIYPILHRMKDANPPPTTPIAR